MSEYLAPSLTPRRDTTRNTFRLSKLIKTSLGMVWEISGVILLVTFGSIEDPRHYALRLPARWWWCRDLKASARDRRLRKAMHRIVE